MFAPYELEISMPLDRVPSSFLLTECTTQSEGGDGDNLDQARAFKICDKVEVEGSKGYSTPSLCSSCLTAST